MGRHRRLKRRLTARMIVISLTLILVAFFIHGRATTYRRPGVVSPISGSNNWKVVYWDSYVSDVGGSRFVEWENKDDGIHYIDTFGYYPLLSATGFYMPELFGEPLFKQPAFIRNEDIPILSFIEYLRQGGPV